MQIVESESRRLHYRLRRERYAENRLRSGGARGPAEATMARQLAEHEEQIKQLTDQNADLRDKTLRARAELANARKRFQREKAETVKYATENVVRELVVVADNLERALESAENSTDAKAVHDGVEMVFEQFLGILRANGLELVSSDGELFDPHFHEAVSMEERDDVEENRIVETLQKGYMLRGRVVRPAMVRVAKAVAPKEEAAAEPVAAEVGESDDTLADLDEVPGAEAEGAVEEVESVSSGAEQVADQAVAAEQDKTPPVGDEVEPPAAADKTAATQSDPDEDRIPGGS